MSNTNATNPTLNGHASNKTPEPNFVIHNIYVKDISFEAPNVPHIFSVEWQPKIDFDLQMNSSDVEENLYEVSLHITVTVKLAEEKTAFIIDVKQAGIFFASGFTAEQLQQVLAITAPNILFPYARETISSLVMRGGFPQFILPPVNFDALYMRHVEEQAKISGKTHNVTESTDAETI